MKCLFVCLVVRSFVSGVPFLLESVVDENDFCFVCLIGEKFSVARKMIVLLCFE